MDAPERGALMLVRFIAVSLIGITVVEIALYLAVSQIQEPHIINYDYHAPPIKILPYLLKSIPALIGVVGLIKSKALARWISDKLDV